MPSIPTTRRPTNARASDPKLPPDTNYCRCPSCGEYFSTVRAFDAHRVGDHRVPGDRRCLAPGGMEARGLKLNARGYWCREFRGKPVRAREAA